jgi:FAD/FMN-containing dehydrogenase
MEVKEKVVAELEKIVGAEHVSTARADLYIYSQDMTENEPSWPDFVVMPDSVEEVQEVLRLANREKIAVTPYSAGSSVGGLAIPLKGGIVLDLGRMNRLIELNEEDRYIIVEPGFTQGDLRRLFDKQYSHLFYSFAQAPPSTSVMANALLLGFGYRHNMIGTNADNINGMEVVLPTGEVVKIGACSVSPYWSTLGPIPSLAGLFVGWQGATGVVTKIALQLWPRHPLAQLKIIITTGIRPTYTFLRKLGQKRICESTMALPFDVAQASGDAALFLERASKEHPAPLMREERISATYDRPPGPDMFGVTITVEADTEDELKAKLALLDVIINEELKGTQFTEMPAQQTDFEDLPMRGGAERLGRLTWIGTMGPTSQWIAAQEKLLPLFDEYRLMRLVSSSPFRSGHYGALRAVVGFNPKDSDEVERTKKFMREALAVLLDAGFVPYKAPYWAVEEMMRRGDPNWVELLKRVKKMLDPNNIMNPGRYGDTRG